MDTVKEVINEFEANSDFCTYVLKHHLVGSTYIVGEGKDIDILILVSSLDGAKFVVQELGYVIEGLESYDTSTFYSARKDNINLLLTQDASFFSLFVKAAQLCRYFKVSEKEERILVHRLLMDDELIYE